MPVLYVAHVKVLHRQSRLSLPCVTQRSSVGASSFVDRKIEVANKRIGAPLMTDSSERRCVIKMLHDLEKRHAWPTAWIIKALQEEWEF